MKILEELWYGNVEPSEYDTSPCKDALKLVCRNEDQLKASFTDVQRELFRQYVDSVQELQTIIECILFQNTFRLGAGIMLEVLGKE